MEEFNMERDVLQVFTAAFISELDMEKSRKVDLLEYVSVAGKDELLYYLATGNIATGFIQESEMLSYTESVVEGLVQEVSAKEIYGKAKGAVTGAGKAIAGAARGAGRAVSTTAGQFSRGAQGFVPTTRAGRAGQAVSQAKHAVKDFAGSKTGKGIGIALAIAAATAASYAAYKRFFSKAAKACKDAPDRKACLQKYKKQAAMAKAQALQAGMAKCASTKDPEKCKASIAKKVAKAKAEAAAIG
jgi:hypothetical protein